MLFRKILWSVFAGCIACFSLKAQTFETRSTVYSLENIVAKLEASGHRRQIEIRDSVIAARASSLAVTDTVETFFNNYHLGLVIYRDRRPFELLGFWDPKGNPVDGGTLVQGSGEVKTPFDPALIKNFKSESVVYRSGLKNGACFYYCDCASVLREGTFSNNQKVGLWKEFDASGAFIKQKQIEFPKPPDEIVDGVDPKDLLVPAHCMMQPDLKICPDSGIK